MPTDDQGPRQGRASNDDLIDLLIEAGPAGSDGEDRAEDEGGNVTDIDLYRMADVRRLVEVLRVVFLLSKQALLCLGLETSQRRREWLRVHEDRLRSALGRVRAVSLADGSRRWVVRRGRPMRLSFPDEFPGKFRVFFWVDDGGDDSELELSNQPVRFEVKNREGQGGCRRK